MNYIHKFELDGEESSFEVFKDSQDRWDMKWLCRGRARGNCSGGSYSDAQAFAKNAESSIRYAYNFHTKGFEAAIKIHNEETN